MKHWASVKKYITDFDISPSETGRVSARGDVFTVPAKEGSIRNITHSQGIREQLVSWSPDGRSIAYISDRTGEDDGTISRGVLFFSATSDDGPCLYARNHKVAPANVADATGLSVEQVERVYTMINSKLNSTRYLHFHPQLLEKVDEVDVSVLG